MIPLCSQKTKAKVRVVVLVVVHSKDISEQKRESVFLTDEHTTVKAPSQEMLVNLPKGSVARI